MLSFLSHEDFSCPTSSVGWCLYEEISTIRLGRGLPQRTIGDLICCAFFTLLTVGCADYTQSAKSGPPPIKEAEPVSSEMVMSDDEYEGGEEFSKDKINEIIRFNAERVKDSDPDVRRKAAEELHDLCAEHQQQANDAVAVLAGCLGDPDEGVRASAMYGLSYCGEFACRELIKRCESKEPLVRQCAAEAIGIFGEEGIAAASALRRLLDDEESQVRAAAAESLFRVRDTDPRSISKLGAMIRSPIATDRARALHALAFLGSSEDLQLQGYQEDILSVVDDENAEVRRMALWALSYTGIDPGKYTRLLVDALDDPSDDVKRSGVSNLEGLAGEADLSIALPALHRLVRKGSEGSHGAIEALVAIGPPAKQIVPALIDALKSDDADFVISAAEALWVIDQRVDESLPVLGKMLRRYQPGVGEQICDLLYKVGPPAAPIVNDVVKALESDDWDLQWAASDALGAIASDDPKVIDALIEAIGHESGIVRNAAASALVSIGTAAIPRLNQLINDRNDSRSGLAVDVLDRISDDSEN